jgi:peptide/nickel transport system substrate-binding protein
VFLNTESKILKNSKVRIALLKSLDKDALIAKLVNRVRVDTPLMGLNQKDWINTPDQKEAEGSLYDAGYKFSKDDKGQILPGETYRKDASGKVLELTLVARAYDDGTLQSEEVKVTTQTLVDSWAKVGVKTNVSYLSEADYLAAIKAKQYDMILAGQSMGYNLDTFPFWHSSQVKEDGLNLSNYRSFAADQEIEKIRESFDKDEKEARQKQLAEIISKEVPAIFLYRPDYLFLTDGKVQNIDLNNLSFESDRFVDIADWCIGKDCK